MPGNTVDTLLDSCNKPMMKLKFSQSGQLAKWATAARGEKSGDL